jgi:hypothetical protein
MKDASEIRNALAHFDLVFAITISIDGRKTRPELHPTYFDVTERFRDRKENIKNLTADRILDHTKDFKTLAADVDGFVSSIPQP